MFPVVRAIIWAALVVGSHMVLSRVVRIAFIMAMVSARCLLDLWFVIRVVTVVACATGHNVCSSKQHR